DERVEDARVRDGDGTEEVRVEEVDAEDEVVVRRGERVPLDGRLIEGRASFDESLVTGESLPVAKEPGDEVVGGSVVVENNAVVEVGEEHREPPTG
ncbi:MAG: hypothetical protein SV760_08450, partial [Halobacteria archaeon]|nr:hypothetical protein [Halobacteria archaeon]